MAYLGLSSLLYYLIIRGYTGRKDTTFLSFWLVFGILCIAGSFAVSTLPEGIRICVKALTAIFFLVFLISEVVICSAMFQIPDRELRFLIVLGAQVRGTRVTDSLRRRLEKAERYLRENPSATAILSGGQGRDEDIAEAEAMFRYLTERGIEKGRLICEASSASTWENLKNSQAFIGDLSQPVGIVTNNFHLYRALMMGKRQGYLNLQGLPASSNPVLFLNYLVREFFACMKSWTIYRK